METKKQEVITSLQLTTMEKWQVVEKFIRAILDLIPVKVKATSETLMTVIPSLKPKVSSVHAIL